MRHIIGFLVLALLCTFTIQAQDHKMPMKDKAKKETVSSTAKAKIGNCVVTGEEATSEYSAAYKGKTYYFCCAGCVKKFQADPEKFIKANGNYYKPVINPPGTKADEIVNTICPVMGEEVDKDVATVTYKGKVYGFCCKSCAKKFAANPESYLKKG